MFGTDCDTFLAHSTHDGQLLIFTVSLPAMTVISSEASERLPVPSRAAWALASAFNDAELSMWAAHSSNAILSVAPPPPQDGLSLTGAANHLNAAAWRQAQHQVILQATGVGKMSAQILASLQRGGGEKTPFFRCS